MYVDKPVPDLSDLQVFECFFWQKRAEQDKTVFGLRQLFSGEYRYVSAFAYDVDQYSLQSFGYLLGSGASYQIGEGEVLCEQLCLRGHDWLRYHGDAVVYRV